MWMHIWVWRHTFESDADWCRSIKNSVHVFAFCFIFFLSSSKWQMYWAGPYEPVVFTFEVSPSPSLSSWVHGWLWTPGNDFKTDCSQSRASARIQSESRGSHAFSLSLSPFSFSLCASFFVECGMYVLSGDVPVDLLSVKGGWGWQLSQTSSRISVSRCWNILLLSRQVTVSDHQSVVTPRAVAVINSCFY